MAPKRFAGAPMWTNENRSFYDRSKLRYPSDLTDEEWALIEPEIPPAKRGGGKRTVDMREVVNGLMYVLSTGCQWRAIPKDLPPRTTVHGYLDLWNAAVETATSAPNPTYPCCRTKIPSLRPISTSRMAAPAKNRPLRRPPGTGPFK